MGTLLVAYLSMQCTVNFHLPLDTCKQFVTPTRINMRSLQIVSFYSGYNTKLHWAIPGPPFMLNILQFLCLVVNSGFHFHFFLKYRLGLFLPRCHWSSFVKLIFHYLFFLSLISFSKTWDQFFQPQNQMVFQANKTGYLCSVSKYVELHVEQEFLR